MEKKKAEDPSDFFRGGQEVPMTQNSRILAGGIGALFSIYVAIYVILSIKGAYWPRTYGAFGVKSYQWGPRGFVTNFQRNEPMFNWFWPLHRLDVKFWHTSDKRWEGVYPIYELERDEIWKLFPPKQP